MKYSTHPPLRGPPSLTREGYSTNQNLKLKMRKYQKVLTKGDLLYIMLNIDMKCVDKDRENAVFQRCVGWCEAQGGFFLLPFEQSFRNFSREERLPPLSALSGVDWRNLSGTAEVLLSSHF